MDTLNFKELLEAAGKEFSARAEWTRAYQHPTGVGDAREDAVREYLRDALPSRFAVDRGKIVDSDGHLSREFDVIISEANDVAPAMTLAGRRIVPVEAVYGVIEVKSSLSGDKYDAFLKAVAELKQMKRYYRRVIPLSPRDPMRLAAQAHGGPPPDVATEDVEAGPEDQAAGRVWSGVIALDGPSDETLTEYFARSSGAFWFICVTDRVLLTLHKAGAEPRSCSVVQSGVYSLPLTVWVIMSLVTHNSRRTFLLPNFGKYLSHIIRAIGQTEGGGPSLT